jgi:uncharacterized membrane protein YfcA
VPPLLQVLAIGAAVGFLGGLLGKGGSAVATPILVAFGVPPILAIAAPLPATIPGTLLAADHYRRARLIDPQVLRWSLAAGLPATVVGAVLTRWIDAAALVLVTDALLVGIGLRLLLPASSRASGPSGADRVHPAGQTLAVALVAGLAAGLLANSGGFLLAPLFITVLRLPVKAALGTSLAVAAALAVPGSLVHLALGHLDWPVVAAFALGSIPLSGLGARTALRLEPARLERTYGRALVIFGLGFLVQALVS